MDLLFIYLFFCFNINLSVISHMKTEQKGQGVLLKHDTVDLLQLMFRNGKQTFFMAISNIWYLLTSLLAVAKLKSIANCADFFVHSDVIQLGVFSLLSTANLQC